MTRRMQAVLAGCTTLAVGVLVATWLLRENALDYPIKRIVRYSFTAQNPTNLLISNAEFWTYAPVKQTATQHTANIVTSIPYRAVTDETGNQRLYFDVKNLPPYASKVITISAAMDVADHPNHVATAKLNTYLRAEKFIESDDPLIVSAAKQLRATDPERTARNIYDWVIKTLKDSGYVTEDRGALYALKHKQGDCTEYMYLFLALARASGLPARGVAGYAHAGNAVMRAPDYHNWVEVYINRTWRIVDPQAQVYMKNASHYIAMRIITDQKGQSINSSQRFFAANGDLKVEMN